MACGAGCAYKEVVTNKFFTYEKVDFYPDDVSGCFVRVWAGWF